MDNSGIKNWYGMRKIFIVVVVLILTAPVLMAQVKNKFDMRIPMRDGVELSADVWMPAEEGQYPAVLIRTPYIKVTPGLGVPQLGQMFAGQGYVLLIQDVRGRGDSDGKFNFYHQEGEDGYDSIEWIARQPWCNGKVGMMGVSYLGAVQWLAAREKPPHLVCIVPTAPSADYWEESPFNGGAFSTQFALSWLNGTSGRLAQGAHTIGLDWNKILLHRPLMTMDEVMGRKMPLYREWLKHSTLDDYWKKIQFVDSDFPTMNLPALHITGWFDGDQIGTLIYWNGMRKYSSAKDKQYLIIGPWNHAETFLGLDTKEGEMQFSEDSKVDNVKLHLDFFDYYLKGSSKSYDQPRVRVYITGSNIWREFDEYPPKTTERKNFYFHSKGKANTLLGDGSLAWKLPKDETPDKYVYDPKDPVPSDIDGQSWAVDNRLIEIRKDVLVYTSEELGEPVTVLGDVYLNFFAASDARDTDFVAKIIDVYPDGKALNLGPQGRGVRRARYRQGYEKEVLLTPGQPEKFRIRFFDIGHTFLQGHKIRIEITSSAFPAISPNQNTGNPIATDTDWKVAHQTIFHDSAHPSHVVLPVLVEK